MVSRTNNKAVFSTNMFISLLAWVDQWLYYQLEYILENLQN